MTLLSRVLGGFVVCLTMVAFPVAGSAKVSSKTSFTHYTVRGATPTEIVVDMWRKRKVDRRDFTIATIATKIEPGGEFIEKNGCRVKNFSLKTTHLITLPRHANERRLRKRTRRLFRALVKRARDHELTHRRIYRGCIKRFYTKVKRMGTLANCRVAARQIKRIADAEAVRCKAEHAAFDRREYARSSRMPLIREALADAKAMKAARISRASAGRALAGDSGGFGSAAVLMRREKGFADR